MCKIKLYILVIITAVCFTACEQKFGGDVTPTPPAAPVSIVGKWSITGFGTITNTKTYEATLSEIKKDPQADTTLVNALATSVAYDFKQDGTFVAGVTAGTWQLLNDDKMINLTSKSAAGKTTIQSFTIIELKANSLRLGTKKFTAGASGQIVISDFNDLPFYLLSTLAIGVKGTEQELDDATSIQGTLNFKR